MCLKEVINFYALPLLPRKFNFDNFSRSHLWFIGSQDIKYLTNSVGGAGIACWLERRTRDRKVASSNPRQERRENFLLQNQICVLTFIRCPLHPRVTAVARKRPRPFCQNRRWQVTPKHADTLDPTKSELADYAAVQA